MEALCQLSYSPSPLTRAEGEYQGRPFDPNVEPHVGRTTSTQIERPDPSQYGVRSCRFNSLPASLRGICSTTSKLRGTL